MHAYLLELKKPDDPQFGRNPVKKLIVCAESDTQARQLAARIDEVVESQWDNGDVTTCVSLEQYPTAGVVAVERY